MKSNSSKKIITPKKNSTSNIQSDIVLKNTTTLKIKKNIVPLSTEFSYKKENKKESIYNNQSKINSRNSLTEESIGIFNYNKLKFKFRF